MSLERVLQRVAELGALTGTTQPPASSASTAPASGAFAARLDAALASGQPEAAAAGVPYAEEIAAASSRHGLDPALVRAVIEQESGFDPRATSPAGAGGLMQLMPGTARGLGVDPYDPAQAIEGGTRYLRAQLDRFGGDVSLALAAYNAGPGAVERFGGVPPYAETQRYVERVLELYRRNLSTERSST